MADFHGFPRSKLQHDRKGGMTTLIVVFEGAGSSVEANAISKLG